VPLLENFNLGMDLRYSKAKARIFDATVDAGGTHLGFLMGYGWRER